MKATPSVLPAHFFRFLLVSRITDVKMTTFESIVGFNLDDLTSINPFKDVYSTVAFAVMATFVATVLVLMAIAFLYSCCECCCSCCGGGGSDKPVKTGSEPEAKVKKSKVKVAPGNDANPQVIQMQNIVW